MFFHRRTPPAESLPLTIIQTSARVGLCVKNRTHPKPSLTRLYNNYATPQPCDHAIDKAPVFVVPARHVNIPSLREQFLQIKAGLCDNGHIGALHFAVIALLSNLRANFKWAAHRAAGG